MENFELLSPTSKSETLSLLAVADEDTRLIAGGTGLINLIKRNLASPPTLISLHCVTDLAGIEWQEKHVTIGALERLIDLEYNNKLKARLPSFTTTLKEVASPRIRSMATLGGAVAHADPNQDLPLALIALDAIVLVESSDAASEFPIAGFYEDYYETRLAQAQMVTGVRIPLPGTDSRFVCKKFTPGSKEDYACVGVAVRLDVDASGTVTDSRIVLGSVGPTIFRSTSAEQHINGHVMTRELAIEAAELAAAETDPVDDTRGSATYKKRMAGVWVQRCLLAAAGRP